MNINLATIDFCPGNGGGEAVIQSLNVTENGEYRAPSGVDGYNPVRVAVSGGSITPEEKAALDTLVDASQGILATNVLEADNSYNIPFVADISDYYNYLFNIDGDVYYYQYSSLYKWNPVTFAFEYIISMSSSNNLPLWNDMTGRFYEGPYYELDLTTGEVTDVDLNITSYDYMSNKHSIWKGTYGVYNFGNSPQKFNESTQQFESFTVNITSGYNLGNVSKAFAYYGFEYDGHFIVTYNSNMFELTEYEDHIDIDLVADPYYPMNINSNDLGNFVYCVDGDLYYLYQYNSYKLIEGTWTQYPIIDKSTESPVYFKINAAGGVIYENYLFGFSQTYYQMKYNLISLSEDVTSTGWMSPVSVGCVDLSSQQNIDGYKVFNNVKIDNMSIENVSASSIDTSFTLNNTSVNAQKIKFTVPGEFSLNNKNIATTEECILNMTILPYGSRSTDVLSSGNPSVSRSNYWISHTGRLFYTSGNTAMEFDGTQWVTLQNPITSDGSYLYPQFVVNAETNTFYNYGGNTYLWDDTSSVFNLIATNSPNTDEWGIWPCDGTLRSYGTDKLVNNGGTWSWETDQLNDYYYGMTYSISGNIYVLGNDTNHVWQYDESTKTYTDLGMFHNWTTVSFSFNGEIFYPWNGASIYKIDLTKVGGSDPYIDVETTIPYTSYDWFYGGYDGFLYYYRTYGVLAYCYDIEESLPEVPASNGTYVLQATRSGDTITYEWVPSNV